MKNSRLLILFCFVIYFSMTSCKKDESQQIEIVSDDEIIDDYNNIIVESVFQDGTKMYFKILSATTACVVDRQSYYGYNSNLGYEYRGDVIIPPSITHLGDTYEITEIEAFHNNNLITSVSIPNTVTSINPNSFRECHKLISVSFGTSLLAIREGSFSGCTSLSSINIPNSVEKIGKATYNYYEVGAFDGCTGLTEIEIPNSVIEIGGFNNCTGLTSLTIPNSVTAIGGFNNCSNIRAILNKTL